MEAGDVDQSRCGQAEGLVAAAGPPLEVDWPVEAAEGATQEREGRIAASHEERGAGRGDRADLAALRAAGAGGSSVGWDEAGSQPAAACEGQGHCGGPDLAELDTRRLGRQRAERDCVDGRQRGYGPEEVFDGRVEGSGECHGNA
jgi:hypothetical protein